MSRLKGEKLLIVGVEFSQIPVINKSNQKTRKTV